MSNLSSELISLEESIFPSSVINIFALFKLLFSKKKKNFFNYVLEYIKLSNANTIITFNDNLEWFYKIKIFQDDETKDYPPCVVNFMKNKVKKGEGRNDAMFNVAVLAKKINPDPVMYQDWTRDMMSKVCEERLHPKELENIFTHHNRLERSL